MRYRVPPPGADSLVAWPADFGTRFTVFCDVEEEFDWRRPLSRANRSTGAIAALPAAHRRFADRGVGWTCMVDHPVATDPAAIEALAPVAADARSAIGAQLHPWVTPPDEEAVTPANSYAGNLPPALEAAKIDALTQALTTAFGARPLAYRAGRYGIGPATIGLLAERGYRIDCSVRAGYDYRANGGPDFRAVGNGAYRVGGLIELPFSTIFTGALRSRGAALHRVAARMPRGPGMLARTGLLNRVSLTPEDMPLAEALEAVSIAIGEGQRLLCFSFHSPSLVPGNTPYVRDAADLAAFHRWWDAMLDHLGRLGAAPASLAQILAAADQPPG
jgi:hypothetical protein